MIIMKVDYEVVFNDRPLGFKLNAKSADAKFAKIKSVEEGGQAAQGGSRWATSS